MLREKENFHLDILMCTHIPCVIMYFDPCLVQMLSENTEMSENGGKRIGKENTHLLNGLLNCVCSSLLWDNSV
jgi:hypothetical protein